MGLKFRRGTNAQKSGSLAFGEPYVNTTLGTLQIGGEAGDVTLLINSASQGISGSSLDITGNAKIDGNLTLGGAITIGDATADTVNVVASLSSSLIPAVTNVFDLGSETKIWRDLYISTGSIKFIGAGNAVVSTLSATSLNSNTASIDLLNTFTGSANTRFTEIGVVSGSLISSASAAAVANTNLNTFSGSVLTRLTEVGVVSGSLISSASTAKTTNDSQDVSITNINTFSGSVLTRLTEIGVVSGSLITSASAAKTTNDSQDVSITNINSTTASLNTSVTNINSTTASLNTSVTNINSTTASLNTSVSNLNTFSGSANTRFTEIGVVSGSLITSASAAKTTNDSQDVSITNINSTTASLNTSVTNLNTTTSSLNTSVTNLNTYTSSLKTALSLSGADLTILGNLTVQGDTTTLNTANLLVEDKLIELAIGTTTSAGANGAGIFISGANASILWDDTNSTLDINKAIDITGNITLTGNVDGVDVSVFNSNVNSTTASLNTSVSNLNTFSGSANTQFTEIGVVSGSLISSASAAKTTNDSQGVSITNINSTTASLNTSVTNLNTATSSYETKGRGIVSGSAQIDGSLLGSNKTITIGSTATTLGGTSTTLAGLTSVTSTAFVGALTGNASTVTTNANLTGNVTSVGNATTIASGVVTSDMIVDGTIVNGDINASAAIVDTKLATISTGGKVSNSATTATSANTVSAIVARDGSGNFSAGTITAALTGNASTATTAAALTTARTINGTSFDGSANITIPNLVSGSSQITHLSTTGYVANEHIDHTGVSITAGDGLTGGGTIAATRTINVVGTANRISVSADAVDIASTYVGQSTITTLGTITAGTWTGTAIASANLDTDTAHLTETQTFSGAKTFSTAVTISDSTASTSKTTGALKVTGGVGVSGDMYVGGDVVAYASSDIRFKENIVPIENALDKISKISGNTYDWKAENKAEHGHEGNDVGVIAQEIEAVLPQLVQTRENGFKAVKYDKLVALLIEGIKEQQTQIEKLRMDLDNYECKCDNCKSK